jgi:hypothetical protein
MTTIYLYNLLTHEYEKSRPAQVVRHTVNGQVVEQELTKVSGGTTIAPPEVGDKEKAVWNGAGWDVMEDHRQHYDAQGTKTGGTPYWLSEDTWMSPPRYMEELGALPEGALLEAPAKPEPTTEELFTQLRQKRDEKLSATDFYFMADYSADEETLAKVKAYRQALRDLPEQDGAPWDGGGEATPWPTLEI